MKESSMCACAVEHQIASLVTEGSTIAVACSGGPDSMALVLLAQECLCESKDERAVSVAHPPPRHAKGSRLSRTHTKKIEQRVSRRASRQRIAHDAALFENQQIFTGALNIVAITIDHALRKESAAEAKQVTAWLKKRSIKHVILKWEGLKPKSNIQEAARNARYQLLTDYCKAHGIKNLLVAHTLDDQAETFLLRLKRGSGVDGLSAMAEASTMHGIKVLRPLLNVPKADLLAYLKEKKQDYIQDPSNENLDYDRVKIRKAMPALAALGLDASKLAKTARSMARARMHLQKETADFIAHHGQIHPEGYATLSKLPQSDELALRVLASMLMTVGGHKVKPRLDDLERLYAQLQNPTFKATTLGSCIWKTLKSSESAGERAVSPPHSSPRHAKGIRLSRAHDNQILIFREQKALPVPAAIKKDESTIWDRFEIIILRGASEDSPPLRSPSNGVVVKNSSAYPRTLQVSALTQSGWLELSKKLGSKNPYPDKRILYTLPTLRDNKGNILAVPHLGIEGDNIKCQIEFKS